MCKHCLVIGSLINAGIPEGDARRFHSSRLRNEEIFMLNEETLAPLPEAQAAYLSTTFDRFRAHGVELRGVSVESDGSCIPHAVSRALQESEVFFDTIRSDVVAELRDNVEWYRANEVTCKQLSAVCDEEAFAQAYDEFVRQAAPTHGQPVGPERYLSPLHIQAIANILRRPILVLTDIEAAMPKFYDGLEWYGLYLPLRTIPFTTRDEDPSEGRIPGPLVIGATSRAADHFCAIVRPFYKVSMTDAIGVDWIKKTQVLNETKEDIDIIMKIVNTSPASRDYACTILCKLIGGIFTAKDRASSANGLAFLETHRRIKLSNPVIKWALSGGCPKLIELLTADGLFEKETLSAGEADAIAQKHRGVDLMGEKMPEAGTYLTFQGGRSTADVMRDLRDEGPAFARLTRIKGFLTPFTMAESSDPRGPPGMKGYAPTNSSDLGRKEDDSVELELFGPSPRNVSTEEFEQAGGWLAYRKCYGVRGARREGGIAWGIGRTCLGQASSDFKAAIQRAEETYNRALAPLVSEVGRLKRVDPEELRLHAEKGARSLATLPAHSGVRPAFDAFTFECPKCKCMQPYLPSERELFYAAILNTGLAEELPFTTNCQLCGTKVNLYRPTSLTKVVDIAMHVAFAGEFGIWRCTSEGCRGVNLGMYGCCQECQAPRLATSALPTPSPAAADPPVPSAAADVSAINPPMAAAAAAAAAEGGSMGRSFSDGQQPAQSSPPFLPRVLLLGTSPSGDASATPRTASAPTTAKEHFQALARLGPLPRTPLEIHEAFEGWRAAHP